MIDVNNIICGFKGEHLYNLLANNGELFVADNYFDCANNISHHVYHSQ